MSAHFVPCTELGAQCARMACPVAAEEPLVMVQVRGIADLLPEIDVVADDPFNSSPTDAKMMGPEVLERYKRGEQLPVAKAKTPLVRVATQSTKCGQSMNAKPRTAMQQHLPEKHLN